MAIIAETLSGAPGLPADAAEQAATEIIKRVANNWGGDTVRIPKGTWNRFGRVWCDLSARDWQIFREYNGSLEGRQEIYERYGIAKSRLYQIIAACRAELAARRAIGLPARSPQDDDRR